MDSLPPELHHQVCGYLPRKDLPSYHLVNKRFGDVGAASLFKSITFHAIYRSFFQVSALASHLSIHKNVKELIWDANVWEMGSIVSDYDSFKALAKRNVGSYNVL